MKKPGELNCILLVDDDEATNFVHRIVIENAGIKTHVQVAYNGMEALEYLTATGAYAGKELPLPGIIFLDINMPKMNGWEFLNAYSQLPEALRKHIVLAMLTTSLNPDDERRAREIKDLAGYITKPLSVGKLKEITDTYFSTGTE